MGSQRVARPSLERGMEAANGKKRTPQHEGVTEGRGGNGRKPPPPHTMCHTPHWASAGRVAFYYFTHPTGHPQGGLLSITLHTPLGIRRAGCFLLLYTPHWASAGRVAFYYFTHPTGHPQGGLLSITLHTPLGIRRAGCFLLLCLSQTPEMHPRPFFGGFWHPQWSVARVLPHPQGHPQASARALAAM